MRLKLTAALLAAASLSACASTQVDTAAPAFTGAPLGEAVPSDLPRIARPLHYRIDFVPDPENLTFSGMTSIDLELYERSPVITLHANELDFTSAQLFSADGRGDAVTLSTSVDEDKQLVRLSRGGGQAFEPGAYRVDLQYTGTINTQASGLFALDYPDKRTGEEVRGLFTQFEAPDARRFAPMFDEPSYKATFDLSATIPANQMAVGNMPLAGEELLPDGRKKVTFRTSPVMSSYLLFFAMGDFERLTMKGPRGVDAGIVSPAGSGEQARYALEAIPPLLAYYEDYFGVPYPLPKLDNIAAPGESQFFGAMENWGAILTFEKYLLLDPTITDPATQNYIYSAQAHEVAHQWFGNIVTMAWWDDLWLNEGFASWMETKATDRFNPDWFQLLTRVNGREQAMALDAFATTHPVVQQIRTVAETNQAFDAISYQKGEAVISMLEAFAGEDTWRQGIRTYIQRHSYQNTRSEDLWRAVEEAGAVGLVDVARDFTLKPGIPLVQARAECRNGRTALSLTQSEFSRDRKDQVAAQPQRWRVPLLIKAGSGTPQRHVLDGSAAIDLPGCGAVVVNGGQLGYFRTLYTPQMTADLARSMARIDPIDQLGLVRDNYALSVAGYQPMGLALDMLAAVPGSANPVVAAGAVARWGDTYESASETDKTRVAKLTRARWLPRLQALGYDSKPGESLVDTALRVQLLGTLGKMGDPTVTAEARRRFALLAGNPKALDGPLKTTWLGIVARNATPAEWERIAELARKAPNAVERQAYYGLLGMPVDAALTRRSLDLALTNEAGTTSADIVATASIEHPDMTFDYALANRAKLEALVDSSGRTGYIAGLAGGSRDAAMIAKLEAFRDAAPADERRGIDREIAGIRERLAREPRLNREIAAWLASQR